MTVYRNGFDMAADNTGHDLVLAGSGKGLPT
jgi:hypothetical protein